MRGARSLLFLALAASACARPAAEPRFLNFDPETSAGMLASGWSGYEKTEAGDTFAWALSREARVVLPATGTADRLVRFRAWPFRWEGAPPQTVSVAVNGARIATVTLSGGAAVHGAVSPAAAWQEGPNTLTFEFAYAEAPADRVPGSDDTRTLAVAFDWVEAVPVHAEAGRTP